MFCKYRDVFGKPKQGVHRVRFLGMAAVDLVGTLAIALGISAWTNIDMHVVFAALMALAIVMHRVFCVDTAINRCLFN